MRMYDLINKKKYGGELSKEEINFMIDGFVAGDIPDYQMSAMLMAIYFNGMTEKETFAMTDAATKSGDTVDLSAIEGTKVDKHSTGGVGDKTTLIVAPIAASCGLKIAKMSGRGLGHTGGTIDKMESIPGMKTTLSKEDFFKAVNENGIAVIGQSGNLAPADKKLYALRDVTATVDSIPLIAMSIMSKKLAAGSDCILLDVKRGSGAFMKTEEDAERLAETMVKIGENAGKRTVAVITNMDIPLGNNIGNSLEVIEAVKTLKGEGPEDLTEVCRILAANMLYIGGRGEMAECLDLVDEAVKSGKAFQKLVDMVKAQGGDVSVILDTEKFAKAPYKKEILADESGYITHMDTEKCGIASSMLGAGRITKDSPIDYTAGIIIGAKTGDRVEKGDVLATMFASDEKLFCDAEKTYRSALTTAKEPSEKEKLVFARVSKDSIERF